MRAWREKRGLTQEQVATKLGTHRGMVSRYENSERGLTLSVQFRVMRILDITPAQFFQDPDDADALEKLMHEAEKAGPKKRREILAVIRTMLDNK